MDELNSHSSDASQILQSISSNVQKIKQLGQELENQNKNISITGNSQAKSDLLNRKEKEAIHLIEITGTQFTKLASYATLDHTSKIQAQLLKGDFQRALQRFQRTQAEIKRRLIAERQATNPSPADLIHFDEHEPFEGNENALVHQGGIYGSQIQAQHGDVQELGFALQQEEQMQALEEDIVNVNIIFEQLMGLVYDQRAAVESIEDNIEAAYVNQEAGTSSLIKAAESRQRSRRRRCFCCLILSVAIGVTILVLIIVYTPRSKG